MWNTPPFRNPVREQADPCYRRPPMTVCIAALADGGRTAVYATDRMKTTQLHGKLHYTEDKEDYRKAFVLSSGAVVLTAGDDAYMADILQNANKSIAASTAFDDAASILATAFHEERVPLIVDKYFRPHGWHSLEDYRKAYGTLPVELRAAMDHILVEAEVFEAECILIGKNAEGLYQVIRIVNPGLRMRESYAALSIGSGKVFSTYSLLEDGYDKGLPLATVEAMVRKAKKKAEAAPGVGKLTHCCVLQ